MKASKAGWGIMIADVIGDMRKHILQTFPERQIYLRSGGEVTYYNLSTRVQAGVVAIIIVMAAWCLLTIVNLAFGVTPFASTDERIVEIESNYQRQLADSQAKIENVELLLSEQRLNFETMAANIQAKHNALSEIVGTEAVAIMGDEPALKFANAEILMAPTLRDSVDRVARRASIATHDIATGLPFDRSLASLDQTQNTILLSAEAELLDKIDFNRALIAATDMDLDSVLEQGTQGQGGPYIPLDGPDVPLLEGEFQPRTTAIQARLYEAEALAEIVGTLPLGHPVLNETVQTSKFGVRRDPFTKRPTHHSGLDFIGGPMAPVVATGPGTVKFAGWGGAYGNMVEIDHGNGFITRYAHMKKLNVKRGQTVLAGDQVGGMGSTGRSTGTHLHYEVHFDGRARDPKKFLKAGRYVH
jgi:murein DD-endopeptidase MepM/ murein hydrolase activator NlpD